MSNELRNVSRTTLSIHAGQEIDAATGAVAPPLFQTSTFAFHDCDEGEARFAGRADGFIYSRMGNPTVDRLERAVAALEGGGKAIACASGMAAVSTVYFALLKAGDHMIGTDSVYGPSRTIMERDFARFGVASTFLDTADVAAVEAAVRPETRLLYVETPANPTIKLTDLAAMAGIAQRHGLVYVVDNTFMSPLLQHPLELGADIALHSMTKFLNGHTDVVGGMLVFKDEALYRKVKPVFNYLGGCVDPHQAWLVLRGLKTLAMRVETAQRGAREVAAWLERHPQVEWVRYPGLASHPQHALAERQMEGPGSLISFEVKGGLAAGKKLLDRLRLMTLAVSLGGIETLIQHPSSMTHAGMPREQRLAAGISDGLVRLSVGCETPADLIADLEQAFAGG